MRPFSVYGPRLRPDLAMTIFTQAIDQGRRLEALEELKHAEKRFVAERDWRPQPGTKEAAEAGQRPKKI